ncbi:MAG: HEAT repeat domain-containing protein [Deltaproteobacteria bacterium]|nr:HEAT repeat domain-containing protein [Deltaproteobacteria bacterium]MCB9788808.1 HEAT repeat domain-containing protein [Deltaproteobacteria bacterium]
MAERLLGRRGSGIAGLAEAVREEAALLAPLGPSQRIAALALAGTNERVDEVDLELWSQLQQLDPAELLPHAIGGGEAPQHAAWATVASDDPDDAVEAALAAAGFALAGVFPMAVTGSGDLQQLRHARARELIALCVAHLAAAGHRTADSIVRRLLGEADLDPRLLSAAIRGLGDGLADAGVAWLASRAAHALDDRAEWLLAGTRVLPWAFERRLPASRELLRHIVIGAADPREAAALLPDAEHEAPRPEDRRLVLQLAADLTCWPAAVRARLVTRAGTLGLLERLDWRRDASAEVLLAGLEALPPSSPVDTEHLRGLLAHPDRRLRTLATRRLMGPRGLKMVPHPAAPRPRGDVVSLPSSALGRTPLDRLRAALVGDEPEAVVSLATGVADEERAAARQTLVVALDQADVAVRRAAVEALGAIGTPEDAGPLLQAARRFRGLEGLVAAALRQFNATEAIPETAELFHRRLKWADDDAIDDFVALAGDAAAAEISTALQTRFYPPARAGAARAVGRIELKEAIFALRTRALTDPNEDARAAALQSMRALAGSQPTAAETAGYALMFTPVDDLEQAIERCRQAGVAALPGIRTTLAKGSWRRRVAACAILARLPGEEAARVLEETLLDPDEDVRLAAWKALVERGFVADTPRTRTLAAMAERRLGALTAQPEQLDLAALEAGLTMGGHVFRTEVLATLHRLEGERRWNLHPEVAAAVAGTCLEPARALSEPDGLRVLLTMIDRTWQLHPHRATLTTALFRVPPVELVEALEQGSYGWRAREAVCHALGRPGDGGAVEPLCAYLQDPDADVRATAVESLVRIGTSAAARGLARGAESPFQEDADAVAQGLAAIGRAAVPALVEMARSPWWEARRVAALALHDWRDDLQEAADLVLPLALDAEYRVAEVARNTLARHGLVPSAAAAREALALAQTLTVPGVEAWLGTDAHGRLRDPEAYAVLRALLTERPPDEVAGRIGVAAALRARPLRDVVDRAARSEGHDHIGLRLAAADALRHLDDPACRLCAGRGAVRCAACEGDGDLECPSCGGQASFERPCPEPDCNARALTRAIDSRACKTCRGRGVVSEPCECATGRVPCRLCHSAGRTPCLLCGGSGETPREPDLELDLPTH